MKRVWRNGLLLGGLALAVAAAAPVSAQAPPECEDVTCENLAYELCSNGFTIALTGYESAAPSNGGYATYTYEICAPAFDGTCDNGDPDPCQDHQDCSGRCTGPSGAKTCNNTGSACTSDTDCEGACSGDCRTDFFQELSHVDVGFPELGTSCLGDGTDVTGTCSKGDWVLGDGSCFTGDAPVAKCNEPGLLAGECLTMTVSIAGELTDPGLNNTVVMDKPGNNCTYNCLAGPSCAQESCGPNPPPGDSCLTRTLGFWGTHPHLIQSNDARSLDLLPITVCGTALPVTAGPVCSTSEALCSSAHDNKSNPTYLALVAQLTAAKLNLAATAVVTGGGCGDWVSLGGESIDALIARCENLCGASKKVISESGCIGALDEFNSSEDGSLDVTPPPFDSPGPALPGECQDARGNGISLKNCQQPS